MEIVLKAKQKTNPRFRFLDFGHRLNPFYKHLLARIRAGYEPPPALEPVTAEPDAVPGAPNAYGVDGAHRAEHVKGDSGAAAAVGSTATVGSKDDSDGDDEEDDDDSGSLAACFTGQSAEKRAADVTHSDAVSGTAGALPSTSVPPTPAVVEPPPADARVIIDRLAAYVAESGPAFADGVRRTRGNDPKFAFLTPTHPHHAYYTDRVLQLKQQGQAKSSTIAAPPPPLSVSISSVVGSSLVPEATAGAAVDMPAAAADVATAALASTTHDKTTAAEASVSVMTVSTAAENSTGSVDASATAASAAAASLSATEGDGTNDETLATPTSGGWVGWVAADAAMEASTKPKRSRFGMSPAEAAAERREGNGSITGGASGSARKSGVVVERVRVVVEDLRKKERRERAKAFAEKLKKSKEAETVATSTADDTDSDATATASGGRGAGAASSGESGAAASNDARDLDDVGEHDGGGGGGGGGVDSDRSHNSARRGGDVNESKQEGARSPPSPSQYRQSEGRESSVGRKRGARSPIDDHRDDRRVRRPLRRSPSPEGSSRFPRRRSRSPEPRRRRRSPSPRGGRGASRGGRDASGSSRDGRRPSDDDGIRNNRHNDRHNDDDDDDDDSPPRPLIFIRKDSPAAAADDVTDAPIGAPPAERISQANVSPQPIPSRIMFVQSITST
jgi:hypothetical protein